MLYELQEDQQYLPVDFAVENEELDELQVAHYLHPITTTVLIPLPEPEQRDDLILRETALCQQLRLRYRFCYDILDLCFQF